jgi:hypothetical protein
MSTASLHEVEIFAPGTYSGTPYTHDDVRAIVANFNRLSAGPNAQLPVAVKLGHEDDQKYLRDLGLQDAGRVVKVWRKGGKLVGNVEGVPEQVARLVNQRAYSKVSAEIYCGATKFSDSAGPCAGKVLRAIALLGGCPPMVKSLCDVPLAQFTPSLTSFSENPPVMLKHDQFGSYRCFAGDSDNISPKDLGAIAAALEAFFPGQRIDANTITPDALQNLYSALNNVLGGPAPAQDSYSDYGPGMNRASTKNFSERRPGTSMSAARKAALMNASPIGKAIRQNRAG